MYNVYNSMLFNAMLIAAFTIRLYRDEKENKDLIWFDFICIWYRGEYGKAYHRYYVGHSIVNTRGGPRHLFVKDKEVIFLKNFIFIADTLSQAP